MNHFHIGNKYESKTLEHYKKNHSLSLLLLSALVSAPVFNDNLSLVAMFGVPTLLLMIRDRQVVFLRTLLLLAFLWCFFQALSNYVNQTRMLTIPTTLGVSSLFVSAVLIYFNQHLQISQEKITIMFCLGVLVFKFLARDHLNELGIFKYVIGFWAGVIAFSYADLRRKSSKRPFFALVYLILMGLSWYYDARYMYFCLTLTAIVLMLKYRFHDYKMRLAALLTSLFGLFFIYPLIAMSGIIGNRAMLQQEYLNSVGFKWRYLLFFRQELFQNLYLFTENLWLGIGSYGKVTSSEFTNSLDFINRYISPINPLTYSWLYNPSFEAQGYNPHTIFGSLLLYCGLGVLPFLIVLFMASIRHLVNLRDLKGTHNWMPMFVFSFFAWSLFFSPVTRETHLLFALVIFLIQSKAINENGNRPNLHRQLKKHKS